LEDLSKINYLLKIILHME